MTALRPVVPDRVSEAFFWDFVSSRPDGEIWELIDGRIVMQAQPTFDHQIIAGNLERMLNEGLERIGAERIALQNPAIDLSPVIVGSQYVPDVGVIDSAVRAGERATPICYLAAEIVSSSDHRRGPGEKRPRLDVKIETYRQLGSCEAILVLEQERFAARVLTRTATGWTAETAEGPDALLSIPSAGLRCSLRDLYARTSLIRGEGAPLSGGR
jgi:hypothetical protein